MHGYEKLIYEYKSIDVFVKYLIQILNINFFHKEYHGIDIFIHDRLNIIYDFIFLIMWISIHLQTYTLFWQGTVLSCDHQMAYLYGYFSPDDLEGLKIKQLIPSLQLPVQGRPLEKVKYQSIVGLLIFYCKRFHIIMLIHLSSENVYQCFI